jgi:hypothetical protein
VTYAITSSSLASIGFGALIVFGIAVFIFGLVLLIRGVAHQGPTTKAEGPAGFKFEGGPGATILLGGLAFAIGGGYLLNSHLSSSPAPAPTQAQTSQPAPPPSSSSEVVPFASVTYPAKGTQVSQKNGLTMGGTVASPGHFTIWILDHPSRNSYFLDREADVNAGEWSAVDRPLGEASDPLPYPLTVVAVLADPQCARSLNQIGQTATSHTTTMPAGCHQFGQVTVKVTRR